VNVSPNTIVGYFFNLGIAHLRKTNPNFHHSTPTDTKMRCQHKEVINIKIFEAKFLLINIFKIKLYNEKKFKVYIPEFEFYSLRSNEINDSFLFSAEFFGNSATPSVCHISLCFNI